MNELTTDRRGFVIKSAALLLGSALVPATVRRAAAADKGAMKMGGMAMSSPGEAGVDGYIMSTSVRNHCGTCEFWGGPRRISADGKTLTITGLGWCNNPDSPNYRKQTTPDHGPMSTWHKWRPLG